MKKERKRVMTHLDIGALYEALPEAIEAVRYGAPADDRNKLHMYYKCIHEGREQKNDRRYMLAVEALLEGTAWRG